MLAAACAIDFFGPVSRTMVALLLRRTLQRLVQYGATLRVAYFYQSRCISFSKSTFSRSPCTAQYNFRQTILHEQAAGTTV